MLHRARNRLPISLYGKRNPNPENQLGNPADGEKDVQDGTSNVQSWLVIFLEKEWIYIQEEWI